MTNGFAKTERWMQQLDRQEGIQAVLPGLPVFAESVLYNA